MKKTERVTIRVSHEVAEKLKTKKNPSAFIREAVANALIGETSKQGAKHGN